MKSVIPCNQIGEDTFLYSINSLQTFGTFLPLILQILNQSMRRVTGLVTKERKTIAKIKT